MAFGQWWSVTLIAGSRISEKKCSTGLMPNNDRATLVLAKPQKLSCSTTSPSMRPGMGASFLTSCSTPSSVSERATQTPAPCSLASEQDTTLLVRALKSMKSSGMRHAANRSSSATSVQEGAGGFSRMASHSRQKTMNDGRRNCLKKHCTPPMLLRCDGRHASKRMACQSSDKNLQILSEAGLARPCCPRISAPKVRPFRTSTLAFFSERATPHSA